MEELMGRKIFRIVLAIIWFVVAYLCYTRNDIAFTVISAVLGLAFLYKGITYKEETVVENR